MLAARQALKNRASARLPAKSASFECLYKSTTCRLERKNFGSRLCAIEFFMDAVPVCTTQAIPGPANAFFASLDPWFMSPGEHMQAFWAMRGAPHRAGAWMTSSNHGDPGFPCYPTIYVDNFVDILSRECRRPHGYWGPTQCLPKEQCQKNPYESII